MEHWQGGHLHPAPRACRRPPRTGARFYDTARISEALVYLGMPGLYYADPDSWHGARKVVWASWARLTPFAERRCGDLPKADPARLEIRAFLDWARRLRAAEAVTTPHLIAVVARLLDLADAASRRRPQ
ncbi:hypothetical protein [Streptomyces sp. NPDC045470]|uniref:hypothetical protein n=1 Tax=Streptomyces sp. NPDC045470 TaxID=3155469 RepID=UPI0033F499B5